MSEFESCTKCGGRGVLETEKVENGWWNASIRCTKCGLMVLYGATTKTSAVNGVKNAWDYQHNQG